MNDSFLLKENRDKIQTMSNMIRYNNAVHIHNENVAEHSFYVSVYAMCLCDELEIHGTFRQVIIEKAITHDIHEIEISDIPHNVKKNIPGMIEFCNAYEQGYENARFPSLRRKFRELGEEGRKICQTIVTLADVISVLQYCEQEIQIGNTKRFEEIVNNTIPRVNEQLENLSMWYPKEKIENLKDILLG